MNATTIQQALREAGTRLRAQAADSAALEARVLLSETLGKPASHLMAWPEQALTPAQQQRFGQLLDRRLAGEPIAYILGRREFWSLQLTVTPAVLIPRPDSELLVELALAAMPAEAPVQLADLGTGSGALAAAIAHERPRWSLWATDRSAAALRVATENFRAHRLDNVRVSAGDWCAALPAATRFDIILSNPPYVAAHDPHLQNGDLRHEPLTALAAGADGLDDIRAIVGQAPRHLQPGGLLLLEHGYQQGPSVRAWLRQNGFDNIHSHRDLVGLERASSATCESPEDLPGAAKPSGKRA
jgi:release factor glutamine methyltransferase